MDDDRNESELADDNNHDNSGPTSSDQQPKATAKKVSDSGQAAGKGGVDLRSRTGGAYIPPARLRLMQAQITDKNSREYQKLAWEVSKKSITGLINKVNVSNIPAIVPELFKHNLIRTRGILCRILIKAQQLSPTFTHVYAALVAVINSKFPKIGELLLRRLIVQFRRYFQRNDKANCIQTSRFIAHLVNQQVAHEVLALEILILLLENVTNDSVEVAIGFLKECGQKLDEISRKGTTAIFERLRSILHDSELSKRVQYMIEVIFAIRKDKFKDHPAVEPELDLIEEADQFTHLLTLDSEFDEEDKLNVFQFDDHYQDNEAKYEAIKKELLDSDDEGDDADQSDDEEQGSGEEGEDDDDAGAQRTTATTDAITIIDQTETNMVILRKTIYLTIQASLDFEECAHKLLKLELRPAQLPELCNMILDCCAQQRTYIKFYGLLAQRFCQLSPEYVDSFRDLFVSCYDTIHRFETCKLRNVAKFFAHLLSTDAIPWDVLGHIRLNEKDTTSSGRVFIKILFQELAYSLGFAKLCARIADATMQEAFVGLFPRDDPQNTRFSINFFTSIGLGGLTNDLREHLKANQGQKTILDSLKVTSSELDGDVKSEPDDSSSSSTDSSDSDSDSSSSSDSSSEESHASEPRSPRTSGSRLNASPEKAGHNEHRASKRKANNDDQEHRARSHKSSRIRLTDNGHSSGRSPDSSQRNRHEEREDKPKHRSHSDYSSRNKRRGSSSDDELDDHRDNDRLKHSRRDSSRNGHRVHSRSPRRNHDRSSKGDDGKREEREHSRSPGRNHRSRPSDGRSSKDDAGKRKEREDSRSPGRNHRSRPSDGRSSKDDARKRAEREDSRSPRRNHHDRSSKGDAGKREDREDSLSPRRNHRSRPSDGRSSKDDAGKRTEREDSRSPPRNHHDRSSKVDAGKRKERENSLSPPRNHHDHSSKDDAGKRKEREHSLSPRRNHRSRPSDGRSSKDDAKNRTEREDSRSPGRNHHRSRPSVSDHRSSRRDHRRASSSPPRSTSNTDGQADKLEQELRDKLIKRFESKNSSSSSYRSQLAS